jgi:hypothetical protein
MEKRIANGTGLERLKNVNRALLATIAALAVGLWAPQLVSATSIAESEANNTGATAQNVNDSFSLDFDANINDAGNLNTSTTIPHVSVRATGDGGTYDFYRFTSNGGTLILDIDLTSTGGIGTDQDTEIGLWDSFGNFIWANDDADVLDPGSVAGTGCFDSACNSFVETTVVAGDYIVGVCRFDCNFFSDPTLTNLISLNAISSSGFYTLHISTPHNSSTPPDIPTTPAPEPSAMFLLASGLAGLGAYSRRRNAHKS